MNALRIATRRSALAVWQAEHVATALRAAHPGLEVTVVPMSTRGDDLVDANLAAVGGKGLFTHELERAMAAGMADLAVHSLKDMPAMLPGGMILAAIPARADPFDAFVSNRYPSLGALPPGARVGTSSQRRRAQILHRHPQLACVPLRGNVNTRLEKLDAENYEAVVLAVAGLQRLGLDARIRAVIDADTCLPAIGQGALALECRSDDADTLALLAALDHPATRACVEAERTVSRVLGGNCHAPLAAFATIIGGALSLRARVAATDGSELLEAHAAGAPTNAAALGQEVADDLLAQGAAALLAAAGA
jgi:hydroxymethylbilane synthase